MCALRAFLSCTGLRSNCCPSPCERRYRIRFYGLPCHFRVLGLLWELCNHARLHGFRLSPVAYVEIAFRVVGCDFRHLPHSRGCRALDITRFYKMEIEAPKHPAFQLLSLAGQDFPRLWLSYQAIQLSSSYANFFHPRLHGRIEAHAHAASIFLLDGMLHSPPGFPFG